jgi:hypothetical protein
MTAPAAPASIPPRAPPTRRPGALPGRATFGERVAAILIALALAAMLVAAASVEPARQGFGTHTRLGLPQCGWVIAFNKPCFTCGMTTAFAHAVRLQFVSAFLAQPVGLLLALATAAGLWPALHVGLAGSRLGPVIARLVTGRVLIALGVLTLAAWGFKLATWPAPAATPAAAAPTTAPTTALPEAPTTLPPDRHAPTPPTP